MKKRVRLTHTVEFVLEGKAESDIQDWLNTHTPEDVVKISNGNVTSYHEEFIDGKTNDEFPEYIDANTSSYINNCLTFRLEISIKFNRPLTASEIPSIGPFEFTMGGKPLFFDFIDFTASREKNNHSIVHYSLKNPDYYVFDDLKLITKEMLEDVSEITDISLYYEKDDMYPIALQSASFVLPYEEFEEIQIPEEICKQVTPEQLGYYGEIEHEEER